MLVSAAVSLEGMTKEDIPTPKRRRQAFVKWLPMLLIFLGVSSGVLALVLTLRQPKATAPAVVNEPASVAIKPSPEAVAKYEVAPDLPKYINLPSIKVNQVRIVQLGVTKDDKIAAPTNIFDAGWYKGSAKPGGDGAMFIYGHISSWEANGAFHDLKKLKPGDTVTVIRGDNQEFSYRVVKLKTYPASNVPMNDVLNPVTAGVQGLNLMTCAGQVIKGTNDFTERLVVYTSLVKS